MKLKKSYKKMIWIFIGIIFLGMLGLALIITGIDCYQFKRNQKIIQTITNPVDSTKNLVVFFSRSGNTELMTRKIASLKNGHIMPIQAHRYNIDFQD